MYRNRSDLVQTVEYQRVAPRSKQGHEKGAVGYRIIECPQTRTVQEIQDADEA
jgi:hypothetical protein